ncbi:MAG: peptide ABC transporter substrate-binding protein [Patescibacteria group bacterium]
MSLFSSWGKKLFSGLSQTNRKLKQFERQHQLDKHLVRSLNKSKFLSLKQIKYFTRVLDRRESRKVKLISAVAAIAIISLLVKIYFLTTVALPAYGGEYSEGLIGSPQFINPILAQSNDVDLDISSLVFSGLMRQDKNRQLTPDLADSYEVSDDQLTYTFHLKKNVKWHDGEPFKADDVIFTVASIQDPEFKSPLSRSFRGVVAEKIDDFTVKFTLKEPFAPFLGLLTFGILPEHLWYNIPAANADLTELNKRPIGTGSWQFENLKKDKDGNIRSYALVKNKDFYGEKPYLNGITFKFFGDFPSLVEAIKNKDVYGLSYLPREYREQLKKYKNINFNNLNQPQYTAIFFNQTKNDLLKADYIRQALALSVDKQKILDDVFKSTGRIIDSPTLPGIEDNPDIKKYSYDPQAASALLEKNGWAIMSTTTEERVTKNIRQKKNFLLTITLTTVDQPEYVKTAELIKSFWEQIGVETKLNIVDKEKILPETIKPREYEILIFGENLGSDPDPFAFWHSSQNEYPGLNLAIFSDKKVDKLLEDARKTNNWETRKKNYLEFQKIVAAELPAIFLYNPTYTYPQNKAIGGFDLISISAPADRFANINEWYIKTKRAWK